MRKLFGSTTARACTCLCLPGYVANHSLVDVVQVASKQDHADTAQHGELLADRRSGEVRSQGPEDTLPADAVRVIRGVSPLLAMKEQLQLTEAQMGLTRSMTSTTLEIMLLQHHQRQVYAIELAGQWDHLFEATLGVVDGCSVA